MIAVAMDAWRVNEQSEPFEELERSEREGRAAIRCGMGKTIDDALATRSTVPGSLEPFVDAGPAGRAASEWDGAGGRWAHSLVRCAEGAALIES